MLISNEESLLTLDWNMTNLSTNEIISNTLFSLLVNLSIQISIRNITKTNFGILKTKETTLALICKISLLLT
jgi:hypothetical protein